MQYQQHTTYHDDSSYQAANPFDSGSQFHARYAHGDCPLVTHDPEFQPLVAALWVVATANNGDAHRWQGKPYIFRVREGRDDGRLTISLREGWQADAYDQFLNVLRRCLPSTLPSHGDLVLNLHPPKGKGVVFSCNL